MKLIVAIATTGRPQIVSQAVNDLSRQTRQPDRIIVSAATQDDIGVVKNLSVKPEFIFGEKGLTRQRNRVLDVVGTEDIVLFLDDDFVMAQDYLLNLESLFRENSDTVALTGRVLADGIGTAGIEFDEAVRLSELQYDTKPDLQDVHNGYGCNMAFRCEPIQKHDIRFDEHLPLYGWLEDVDFSRKIAAHGHCLRSEALRGVHLGTKGGRTSGVKLGYSQVINPIYLMRKQTMRWSHVCTIIGKNLMANTAKSVWSEPWVDRRGRLRGNLIGLFDACRGKIDPRRVLALGNHSNG